MVCELISTYFHLKTFVYQIRRRIDFLLTRAWREAQQTKPGHEPVVISMSHFLPMLILLITGIVITTVIFIIEVSLHRSSKRLHLNALHLKHKEGSNRNNGGGVTAKKYDAKQWEHLQLF